MIHVDRTRVPVPPSLAAAGAAEREAAIRFFDDPGNLEKSYPFAAYKAPDVREALNELFHEKCAYCETRYRAMGPGDIEHFRPKGAISIDGRRCKPGYYWLAAEWENLLPSCIDCNRARTQKVVAADDEDDVREVVGKENKFPLLDETRRARKPDDLPGEDGQALLLHPCVDHPEEHLRFLGDGLVRARDDSLRGRTSIEVFALLRKPLKEERRELLLGLALKMRTILFPIDRLQEDPGDLRARAEAKRLMRELRGAMDPRQPYSGLARQFITAFEAAIADRTCHRFVAELIAKAGSEPV